MTPDSSVPAREGDRRALEALAGARERLREACMNAPIPAPEPELLAREVGRVVDAIEARLTGRPAPVLPAEEADRPAILDALRAIVLEAWPEDERGLLAAMRALEAVRAEVSPADGDGPLPPGTLSPYGHRLLREIAHTLRSPLGSLMMLTATLRDQDRGDLDAAQRRHLGLVYRATTTLAAMANDLLALSGEEEELGGEPVPFAIDGIVDGVAATVAPIAEERGVAFRVELEVDGPRVGRPAALARALTGLTLGAAALVREGELSLRVSADGDQVGFRVDATAADDALEEVFDVFPLPPGASDYTLSGRALGFAVARRLVRRMGSELEVERRAGGGIALSFRLALPAAG